MKIRTTLMLIITIINTKLHSILVGPISIITRQRIHILNILVIKVMKINPRKIPKNYDYFIVFLDNQFQGGFSDYS